VNNGRAIVIILLLILFVSGGIRFLRISADAPQTFPNGFSSSAPVKDEAAKSYEARYRALFGRWTLSERDDYRYWKTLSPVWTYSLWLWFEAFGVSYFSVRLFSIVLSLISTLLIYLILKKSHGASAGLAAAFLFGFNFYLLIYGRLGLMETALNAALILTAFIMTRSLERPGLFIIAPLAFLAAFLVKQSAFFFAPLLVLGFLMMIGGIPPGQRRASPQVWLSLLVMVASALVILYLFTRPDYQLRSIMNLRHALGYPGDTRGMNMRPDFTRDAIRFAVSFEGILRGYVMMMPVAGVLAVLEIIAFIYLSWKKRMMDRKEAIIIGWFIMARATLALSPHHVVRFYLIQFPPTCLLAGILLRRVLEPESEGARERHSRLERLSAYWSLLLLSLAFNMLPYVRWLNTATYEIRQGGIRLEHVIGARDVVIIGEWAGPLCLETPYRYYYVKSIFNRSPNQVASFNVTHVLYSDPEEDTAVISLRYGFPGAFEKMREIDVFKVFDKKVHLCQVSLPGWGEMP
jgi:4-amino-4-deoxy-L-arabinose transferase-like glycosyltransferase